MNILRYIHVAFRRLAMPVRHNLLFFTFMYVLLAVSVNLEIRSHDRSLYFVEFFFDIYMLCALLYAIPERVARWFRWLFYFIGYITCVIEAFLLFRFILLFSPVTMQLCLETNSDEASEFFSSYLWCWQTAKVVLIYGSILLLNILFAFYGHRWFYFLRREVKQRTHLPLRMHPISIFIDILIPILFFLSVYISWEEKCKMYDYFFKQENTVKVERTESKCFYSPCYRLLYSFKFLLISDYEIKKLKKNMLSLQVDSCTFRCPNVVLIIGESYNKRHSQLYGYDLPTTPYQLGFARNGSLVAFTDVVTPWNVTSNCFKSFMSTHSVDQPGVWADGVLFPAVFRKAGYKVAFITNQFNKSTRQNAADFNGSFFLNDELLDSLSFDYRNTRKNFYDKGFIKEYQHYTPGRNNLVMFHLMGQHLEYNKRFKSSDTYFHTSDIHRPDLDETEKQIVADYDNATRYNDWVIARIFSFFKDEDAIVIYFSDHGEEVYGELPTFGRNHDAEITPSLARAEFEIPFEIWFTRKFRRNHREIVRNIHKMAHRPFAIDDIPHLMFGLAGIHCPQYNPKRDLLNDSFNSDRPRILKRMVDYNELMKNEKREVFTIPPKHQ
ncbi:MAG: phosphoethanolamine transferase [Bacteroidaceae bacterium]